MTANTFQERKNELLSSLLIMNEFEASNVMQRRF